MKNELANKAITALKTYVKSKEKYVEDKEKYKSSLDNILGAIVNNHKLVLYYALHKALHKMWRYSFRVIGFENTITFKPSDREGDVKYIAFLSKILEKEKNKTIDVVVTEGKINEFKFKITDDGIKLIKPEIWIRYKDIEYLDDFLNYIYEELKPLRVYLRKQKETEVETLLSIAKQWFSEKKIKISLVEIHKTYETFNSMTEERVGSRTDEYGCIKFKYKEMFYYIEGYVLYSDVFTKTKTVKELVSKVKTIQGGRCILITNSEQESCSVSEKDFIKKINRNKYDSFISRMIK